MFVICESAGSWSQGKPGAHHSISALTASIAGCAALPD